MNDKFTISVYCGPQPPIEVDGIKYPDRIKIEQYQLLKDMGINTIYGQCDIMNTDTEEYAFRALDFCAELGLDYLVKDQLSREYCSLGEPMFKIYQYKDFRKLSEEEKCELDARFERSLLRYKDHKAFKGMIFIDEPGKEMFDGIARAKKVFDRVCPDKLFLVNHLHHQTFDRHYQFAWQDKKDETIEERFLFKQDRTKFKYDGFFHDNALERYERFIDCFFEKVDAKIFSYDIYPFVEYKGLNIINKALYSLPQLANKWMTKRGGEFWVFLQCGGKWDDLAKVTTFSEVQLSVSVALALGAKGIELYTGCFSNDCLPKVKEESGVIDEFGNVTNQYDFYRYALRQTKAIEKYVAPATLSAVIMNGEYFDNNPSVEEIRDVYDANDIYKGLLPPYGENQVEKYKELVGVGSKYQVLVSCFENNGKRVYMVVNTSPIVATDVKLVFDKEYEFEKIIAGKTEIVCGKEVKETCLPAGENLVLVLKK